MKIHVNQYRYFHVSYHVENHLVVVPESAIGQTEQARDDQKLGGHMAIRGDSAAVAYLVGAELSARRAQAHKTIADAAKALGCSNAKIHNMESGRNQQRPDEVETLVRFYGSISTGCAPLQPRLTTARRGGRPGRTSYPIG
ncbi:helix-turn-helix domain-containing protein [Nocardia nova]|uniref:helix-turn-helix domain-containing protein n=1 Tax=Nocardia nova TaxID=37330 RepID=UPI001C68320A|nr:helix-turn-helix transcriptional regulator [Nocardia nova]